jgi:hypothetical protein
MSITSAQWRKLACSLPEVEEMSHFEQPDFRVRKKIFAGLSRDGKLGTLKLTPEFQAMLIDAKPKAFVPAAGAWGAKGWTRVVLANVDAAVVPELMLEAWRLVAPKTLVAAHGAPQPAGKKSAPKKKAPRRAAR